MWIGRVLSRILVYCALSHAAEILRDSPVIAVHSGRVLQNHTVTVRCSPDDYNVTTVYTINSPGGVTRALRLRCLGQRYVYELQLQGFTPATGRLQVLRSCRTRSASQLNNATAWIDQELRPTTNEQLNASDVDRNAPDYPTGRRLLAEESPRGPLPPPVDLSALDVDACFNPVLLSDDSMRTNALLCLVNLFRGREANGTTNVNCPWSQGVNRISDPRGFTCNPLLRLSLQGGVVSCNEQLRQWNVRQQASCGAVEGTDSSAARARATVQATQAMADYMRRATVWQSSVAATVGALNGADSSILNLLKLRDEYELNASRIIAEGLVDLNRQTLVAANITKQHFEQFQGDFNAHSATVTANRDAMTANMVAQRMSWNAMASDALTNGTAAAYRIIDNVTAAVQARLQTFADDANRHTLDLDEFHRANYRLLFSVASVAARVFARRDFYTDLVASVRRRMVDELYAGRHPFLTDTGAAPIIDSVVRMVPLETVHIAFLESLGGNSYQANVHAWTLSVRTDVVISGDLEYTRWEDVFELLGPWSCDGVDVPCVATVTRATRTCLFNASAPEPSIWSESLDIDATVCIGALARTPPVRMRSPNETLAAAQQLCESIGGSTGARIGAVQRRAFYTVAANFSVCSVSLAKLRTLARMDHPLVGILGFFELGALESNILIDALSNQVYGVLPNGLSVEQEVFPREAGQAARCMRASFMTYSLRNNLLPVYRLVPVAVEAQLEVFMDGVLLPPFARRPSDAIRLDHESLLPEASELVVGHPNNESIIYDIPLRSISISPFESHRRDKATYAYVPSMLPWSPGSWAAFTGATFNHEAARLTPRAYRISLVASGQCSADRMGALGPWCERRDRFALGPHGTNTSRLTLRPVREASYDVQITIPIGDITRTFVTGCPTATLLPQTRGAVLLLMTPFTAAATNTLEVVVYVDYFAHGDCENQLDIVDVNYGSNTSYFVPLCPGAPNTTVSLFRVDTTTLLGEACPAAQNLDVIAITNSYATEHGTGSIDSANYSTAVAADYLLNTLQRVDADLTRRMLELALGTVYTFQWGGAVLNASVYAGFLNLVNTTSAYTYVPVDYRPAHEWKFNATLFDNLRRDYETSRARLLGELGTLLNNTESRIVEYRRGIDAAAESLRALVGNTTLLNAAAARYAVGYLQQSQSMVYLASALTSRMNGQTAEDFVMPDSFYNQVMAPFSGSYADLWQQVMRSSPGDGNITHFGSAVETVTRSAIEAEIGNFARPTAWYISFTLIVLCAVLVSMVLTINYEWGGSYCSCAIFSQNWCKAPTYSHVSAA